MKRLNKAYSSEIRVIFKECLKLNLSVICSISIIFFIGRYSLLGFFTNDNSIIMQSSNYLIIMFITLIPKTLNVIIGSSIRAMGNVKWMLVTQIIGTIITVAFSYLLVFIVNLGTLGVFLTFFIDEFFRACINYVKFLQMTNKQVVNVLE